MSCNGPNLVWTAIHLSPSFRFLVHNENECPNPKRKRLRRSFDVALQDPLTAHSRMSCPWMRMSTDGVGTAHRGMRTAITFAAVGEGGFDGRPDGAVS
jgi:ribosome modulation factor